MKLKWNNYSFFVKWTNKTYFFSDRMDQEIFLNHLQKEKIWYMKIMKNLEHKNQRVKHLWHFTVLRNWLPRKMTVSCNQRCFSESCRKSFGFPVLKLSESSRPFYLQRRKNMKLGNKLLDATYNLFKCYFWWRGRNNISVFLGI